MPTALCPGKSRAASDWLITPDRTRQLVVRQLKIAAGEKLDPHRFEEAADRRS